MRVTAQKMKPAAGLITRLANRIRDELPGYSGGFLPTISDLCATLGSSRPTVGAALAILQSEGLLKTHRGRRTEIVGRMQPISQPPPKVTSFERVYSQIAERIADGTYRAGHLLPKCSIIGKDMNVSSRTIARVMRRLTREGLVHRLGSSYASGPHIEKHPNVQVTSPSILVVITNYPSHWEGLRTSLRNRPFIDMFMTEANRYRIRIVNVAAKDFGRAPYSAEVPEGTDGLNEVVRGARGRYVGALVVVSSHDPPGLSTWLDNLLSFRRPVVWFDRADERLATLPHSVLFTCCRHDEAGMARAAVDFLCAHDHRRAFYPHRHRDWQEMRGLHLSACGARSSPPLQVETLWYGDPVLWQNPRRSGLVDRLAVAAKKIPALCRALKELGDLWPQKRNAYEKALLEYTPTSCFPEIFEYSYATRVKGEPTDPLMDELARLIWTAIEISPVLQPGGPTALIATHDRHAQVYLSWVRRCGLVIPKEFSVISFDNEFSSSFSSVTSVDPGFSELGYQAFHAILRDIPTRRRGRNGVIDARPMVIDGGQVGVADKKN